MWDLKLVIFDVFLNLTLTLEVFFFFLMNFLFTECLKGWVLFTLKTSTIFPQNFVFIFSIKFFLCIAFLILIRGGTPRYRYDYLTKLGWLKFLSLILFIFITSLLFFYFI